MKAADIVRQLSAEIPKYTGGFTASVGVTSITPAGTTATVVTDAAHGLTTGDNAGIIEALAPVQIDIATFSRTGTAATFETLQDHDLTLSDKDITAGGKTIVISGATEAEFNGTFSLAAVSNRRTLTITVADSGPTTISGSPLVEDAGRNPFNGVFPATVTGADSFTYELPWAYTVPAIVDAAQVQTAIRVGAVLDIVQFLNDVYTKQTIDDDMLIVQLGDVTASKRRDEQTDATSSDFGNYANTPVLVQPFAVYVIQNVTNELAASEARDRVEGEYVPAIMRAVGRAKFQSGFSYDYGSVTFIGHGVFAYADQNGKNRAIYVHEATFEQLCRLTKGDMFDPNQTAALRDIDYILTQDIGTGLEEMTATVDLDEDPLP